MNKNRFELVDKLSALFEFITKDFKQNNKEIFDLIYLIDKDYNFFTIESEISEFPEKVSNKLWSKIIKQLISTIEEVEKTKIDYVIRVKTHKIDPKNNYINLDEDDRFGNDYLFFIIEDELKIKLLGKDYIKEQNITLINPDFSLERVFYKADPEFKLIGENLFLK